VAVGDEEVAGNLSRPPRKQEDPLHPPLVHQPTTDLLDTPVGPTTPVNLTVKGPGHVETRSLATHDAYSLFCGVSALALARAFRPTAGASDCLAPQPPAPPGLLLLASFLFQLPSSFLPSSSWSVVLYGRGLAPWAVSTACSPFPIVLARAHPTNCI